MDNAFLRLKIIKNKRNKQLLVVLPKKKLLKMVDGKDPKYLKIKNDGDYFDY
jgi:hypothetical protein